MTGAPEDEDAVVVDRLTVRYRRATACDAVSLRVRSGSVYALLGRDGAGKSSLARCVLGQQRPSAGRATLFGKDVWKERARLMTRVGAVPEEPDAPPAMTARQIMDFCRRLYPSWDEAGVAGRVERLGVPADIPFRRLTKEQQQGIMLAAALGHRPQLLVLDDPTLGLNPAARETLLAELIGVLADSGTTIFLATRDLSSVEGFATRVGILKGGRLVLDEEIETLKARFRRIRYGNDRTVERAEYGTELDDFDAVRVKVRGWGVDAVVSNFTEWNFERFRRIEGVVDAEVSTMPLEEIFLAVVGERTGEARHS